MRSETDAPLQPLFLMLFDRHFNLSRTVQPGLGVLGTVSCASLSVFSTISFTSAIKKFA